MRTINLIVIHCDDTANPKHDNIETIRQFHLERGFNNVGYNYFIRSNGTIEIGRRLSQIPAHVEGHNKASMGICLHGKDEFSRSQLVSCARLCLNYLDLFNLPLTAVVPHSLLDKHGKTCPNFDIKILREIIASEQRSGHNLKDQKSKI